ncbi:transcriptional regulator family: Fungal Specific TF [Penicillium maclennaniae]|uniref:transcriptional regulator family: Fungal Specific TF n=1 Tax=Penicillium maclennaniae TaxID=1343394 RepID=UPI002541C8AC|nr:transcriptional regulator family: Fungal Specific TF [Penicillium maclennaniae]KAJ5670382.1 transcriptional regulator family: Fungal Specific TF [Penicillium maclennaniae]
MPPSDSRTKIRPQQSCLKCRERKVKCDRSVPCHACIIRGLEAECTYLTTAEDRAHISQAEIIERLRREVAQLRGQLNQGPRQSPSPNPRYARAHTGQSPGSGSSNAGVSVVPGPGADAGAGACYPGGGVGGWGELAGELTFVNDDYDELVQGQFGPVEIDVATVGEAALGDPLEDATISQCHAGSMAYAPSEIPGSIPMYGFRQSMPPDVGIHPMQMYGGDSPGYAVDDPNQRQPYVGYELTNYIINGTIDGRSHTYQQWVNDRGHQVPLTQAYPDSSHYTSSSLGGFSHNPAHLHLTQPLAQNAPHLPDESFRETPFEAIPDSWKGEGKKALLETLFRTISSCDEERVGQVVQVVRSSTTPEEAVSGICQVLGIGP